MNNKKFVIINHFYKVELMIKSFCSKFVFVLIFLLYSCPKLQSNEIVHQSGNYLQFFLPGATATLTLCHKDGEGTLQLCESLLLSMGITYALKYSINEERPNGSDYSFPSGHTSTSFSTAEFIRGRYGWGYGIPAYLLASFVGYSRVNVHEHYTHDVIAGAAIGIVSAYIFTKPFHGWQINIEGDTKSVGLRFSRSF